LRDIIVGIVWSENFEAHSSSLLLFLFFFLSKQKILRREHKTPIELPLFAREMNDDSESLQHQIDPSGKM